MLHAFASRQACVQALAAELSRCLAASPAPRTLLLPGGSTPQPLLHSLALQASVDWPALLVSPTDERWVAADAPGSNLRLLRDALPQARLLDPRQAAAPAAAAQAWGQQLAARLPLSAVLLGMGDDGHVASLFPGMSGITAALDPALPPMALCGLAAQEPRQRLTPNLSMLLASRWLGLLVFGEAKRALLEQVLAAPQDSALPVAALVRAAEARLQIWWAA